MKQLVVNKKDLRHNINTIKNYVKEVSKNDSYTIIGIVKGNGYGLELLQYSNFLVENGVRYLAVATKEEAIELSQSNIECDVLMLSPLYNKEELEEVIKNNVTITIDSKENADMVNELAKKGYKIKTHIKIDTGFGRYGFVYNDIKNIVKTIKNLEKNVEVEGIFSHFSLAYYKNNKHTIEQFENFMEVLKAIEGNDIKIELKHICNSPAILNYPEMALNAARIGSAFVGRVESENDLGLKKIGELEVEVAEIRKVPSNFNISYLNTYKTKRETTLAILPVGYIEGYNLGSKTDMFRTIDKIRRIIREIKGLFKKQGLTAEINGKNYNVIGTTGMYHLILDVTGDNVKAGDIAKLKVNPLYVVKEIRREYIE